MYRARTITIVTTKGMNGSIQPPSNSLSGFLLVRANKVMQTDVGLASTAKHPDRSR